MYTVFVFVLCTKSDIIYFALNGIFNGLDEFRAFCGSDHTQWSHANKSKHTQNMKREGQGGTSFFNSLTLSLQYLERELNC